MIPSATPLERFDGLFMLEQNFVSTVFYRSTWDRTLKV